MSFKVLIFFTFLLIRTQVFAQVQAPPVSTNPWSKTNLSIRGNLPEVDWPQVSLTIASEFPDEAQFNALKPADKSEKIMTFCLNLANQYQLESKSRFQIKNFGQFFKGTCNTVHELVAKNVPEYSQLPSVKIYIVKQLDLAYLQIYYMPNRENWKNSEELISSYKNSVFGMFGLPLKYSYLIEQLLLISALCLALIGLRKK